MASGLAVLGTRVGGTKEAVEEDATGLLFDPPDQEALRALLLLPPHGLKVIVTTRMLPRDLALVEPGRQQRMDLEEGLAHPYAENVLRAMDVDGTVGLKNATDALLAEARERTRGYPRALEYLFGILRADRDTSLQEILDNTQALLPEEVVSVRCRSCSLIPVGGAEAKARRTSAPISSANTATSSARLSSKCLKIVPSATPARSARARIVLFS